MKLFIVFCTSILLVLGCGGTNKVMAGDAYCTALTTTLTSPQTYSALSSDCIIRVAVPIANFGFVRVQLPASPSTGDEYTLREASDMTNDGPYWDDELQEWVATADYTGGTSFYDTVHQINDELGPTNEAANYTAGRYLKVVFDGTYWQLTTGTF